MPLNGTLKPSTLYIALDSRPLNDEYHWALVTTDASRHSTLRHASNLSGTWKHEEKDFRPDERMMLIALVKVANICDAEKMVEATRSVPVDGLPSRRTGRDFNCLTWLLDAIVALDDQAIISLPCDIDTLEEIARNCAARYAEAAETGRGATVVDDPLLDKLPSSAD
ncbi:uncharacterized protein F4817DRAFT_97428 [Daldinia loculata]|uniref:uncharacterized protein n=1 Tax=Daldinia loculata TaxID=103429 RepID=UPI0020C52896|nr:uncharacterized protein F4817DRAFT_97428 [Daldinia loculata]KAI1647651.1 hypothetical protein F4817DRAFT_97428 [Daldinia loculata]